ncbi:hypothetical protein DWW59_08225 [Firmicutes bacterium AF16-15]|nr:hypothetical protein DWW59_08225 [Firmicutes bacterium AF16-15]
MTGEIVRSLFVLLAYKTDKDSKNRVINEADALKGAVKKILGAVGITVSMAGVVKFGKDAMQAASDVEQMEQKFNVVFDTISKDVDAWAENLANAIGRSKNSIKTYLADNQNLLVGFGMDRQAAAQLSEQMVESAIDIASFANLDEDAAVNAMSKALMGETECAKQLGAVLNDNTIATAMETMGLKGKFTALDEATKMQVRYTAIMNQSQDAMGDAVRSMDSYESQSRQLNAQLKEIKENVGKFILPYANKVVGILSKGATKLKEFTERLGDVNEEGTTAHKVFHKVETVAGHIKNGLERLYSAGKKVVNFVGGTENAVKLLSVAVGALLAYRLGEKIYGATGKIKGMLKVIQMVGAKGLVIIGIAVALFLIIQDFIGFLNGKDSLFGELLKSAGVDIDAAREKFAGIGQAFWDVFGYIKQIGSDVMEYLSFAWAAHGSDIMEILSWLLNIVGTTIGGILSLIEPFVSLVVNLIKGLFVILTGDTEGASEVLSGILEALKDLFVNFGMALWNILNAIFGGIPAKMLEYGMDMLQGFIDGIKNKISALKENVKKVANTVKEFLHFSKPDTGPLADADTWMPDMMQLFTKGITANKGKLKDVVKDVAGVLKGAAEWMDGSGFGSFAGVVTVNDATAAKAGSNRSIIQNINFQNTFNGGAAENQKQASKQMDRNAKDAGTYLAHALALGR